MVASAGNDLYTPFPPNLIIEDGVQSSEESSNSDIHSPVFEVPYPPEVRYHLAHQLHIPDASASLISPSFDARYSAQHDLDVQGPDPHLLGTLQPPGSRSVQHLLPHLHSHVDYSRVQHPVLDLGMQPPPLIQPPSALSPSDEYSFNLSQTRIPEQQLRASYDSAPPATHRGSIAMAPAEHKTQPPAQATAAGKGNASGGSSQSQPGPSRPRREASTVVIACRQCRARKIRCDSTRPVCHNCTRRGNECEYDTVPKRRGPDKRPGTRQRSCKKRPPEADSSGSSTMSKKRRKIDGDHDGNVISFEAKDSAINNTTKRSLLIPKPIPEEASVVHLPQPPSHVLETSLSPRGIASEAIYPKDGLSPVPKHSPFHAYNTMQADQRTQQFTPAPTVDYWDHLLNTYAHTRQDSLNAIFDDLDFLIRDSSYWLFFLDRTTFLNNLQDPNRRRLMHPSLVLSALAMARLMQSSDLERGARGRMQALELRDTAQAMLDATCSAARLDPSRLDFTLAEAALILALFESSCHPQHSTPRAEQSLQILDQIIRALSLTRIDQNDPDVCLFRPEDVPTVFFPQNYRSPGRCSCPSPPLSPTGMTMDQNSLYISCNPDWDRTSPDEMMNEERRRICWSALNLVASYTAQCVALHVQPMDLFLADPSNYSVLFPGEAYARTQPSQVSPKESAWSLYCRSMLLWISCIRPRDNEPSESQANFAISAWVETRTVQDALDMHRCNTHTALMYMSREYIYNTRLTITDDFRRLQGIDNMRAPTFNRRQVQEWLYYQEQIAQQVKLSVMQLGGTQGHLLSRRPFQTTWYCSQVLICLELWRLEPTLTHALELGKSFLIPLDTLNALWPCAAQALHCQELRDRLTRACAAAGLPPPLPADVVLPPVLRRTL